jgi:hypothetical protein
MLQPRVPIVTKIFAFMKAKVNQHTKLNSDNEQEIRNNIIFSNNE